MKTRQSGMATVEFAVIGALFFVVLLGIIEFGRVMYAWSILTEGTRRGARVAAVCPVNHSAIRKVSIFAAPGGTATTAILPGLSEANVNLEYLNASGAVLTDPVTAFRSIRYVRIRLQNFQHELLIPFMTIILNSPAFEATLPRESLGVPRVGAGPECFGTST